MNYDDIDDVLDDDVKPEQRDVETETAEPESLQYKTVFSWFEAVFQDMVERYVLDASEHKWCDHWHHHPEVLIRITALWRAWEHLSTDADTGMSVWLRDHLDHHLPQILSPSGPLRNCEYSSTGHKHECAPELGWSISAAHAEEAMLEVA